MAAKDDLGRAGEALARRWLVGQGMQVLDTNWRCPQGELDLVCRDGTEVVFVEVKTRSSTRFGHPAEAVTPAKLARLRRLAATWLAAHRVRGAGIRIDVIAIVQGHGRAKLEHLKAVG